MDEEGLNTAGKSLFIPDGDAGPPSFIMFPKVIIKTVITSLYVTKVNDSYHMVFTFINNTTLNTHFLNI